MTPSVIDTAVAGIVRKQATAVALAQQLVEAEERRRRRSAKAAERQALRQEKEKAAAQERAIASYAPRRREALTGYDILHTFAQSLHAASKRHGAPARFIFYNAERMCADHWNRKEWYEEAKEEVTVFLQDGTVTLQYDDHPDCGWTIKNDGIPAFLAEGWTLRGDIPDPLLALHTDRNWKAGQCWHEGQLLIEVLRSCVDTARFKRFLRYAQWG